MSAEDLARVIGVATRTVYRWERGETSPSRRDLESLAKILGAGKVPPRAGGQVSPPAPSEVAQIPRYDLRLAAGVGASVLDEKPKEFLALKMSSIRRRGLDAGRLAYFEVAGDSMQPTLDDGDLVLTDLRQSSLDDLREGIYACRLDGDVVVKYLERAGGDGLRMVSRNPNYPPRLISCSEVDSGWFGIIGRVCMVQHWFPVVNLEE